MVCDACMGSGKSSAAITYMNEHPDSKFIYITPYLDEAARIKESCPALKFEEPKNKYKEYEYRKHLHTAALVREGKNISTTHQAFRSYTPDMLDQIREKGYTLIVDENIDVLEGVEYYPDDLDMAVDGGYVSESDGIYRRTDKPYRAGFYSEMFRLLGSRELIRLEDGGENTLFFWTLPPDLLTSFKDVFILTYMFDGQSLHHLMQIYDIPYTHIGIEYDGKTYRFGEYPGYTPEYAYHLKDMVDILYNEKLNEIGDEYHALSKSWFDRGGENIDQLRKNISNYFNNICRDIPADQRLWAAFKDTQNKLKGKGYANSYLTFNAKATNNYRGRICLAYAVNIFMNVGEKVFYQTHGIDVDEEAYAMSVMVQWIWRSAIRDGVKINIYIPSKRMRTLLAEWIDTMSKGGSASDEERKVS